MIGQTIQPDSIDNRRYEQMFIVMHLLIMQVQSGI